MQQTEKLELWGVVELFGHTRIAGKLTEQNIAGANMLRVDVPESKSQPPFTRFLNHAAIYAINPTTEEVARSIAERLENKPIDSWDIRKMQEKLLLQLKGKTSEQIIDELGMNDNDNTDEY